MILASLVFCCWWWFWPLHPVAGIMTYLSIVVCGHYDLHSGYSATIRESNHGLGVCKEHYAYYFVPKSSILVAGTGVWKISSVACGFSSIQIDHSDYPKSLISRINKVYVFFSIKYRNSDILLKNINFI